MAATIERKSYCEHGSAGYHECDACRDLMRSGSWPAIGYSRVFWEHELKILPEFFEAVVSGLKGFEICKNDRDYRVGDVLILKEWDGEKFTGRVNRKQVTYLTDFEQKPGYVVMGLGIWLSFRKRP